MIIVIGSVHIQPDNMEEALEISREHCARSRAEPGCIAHNVSVDGEDPTRIVFVEYWEDMAALKTHFTVPESAGFVQALSAMATARPDMKIFSAEEM